MPAGPPDGNAAAPADGGLATTLGHALRAIQLVQAIVQPPAANDGIAAQVMGEGIRHALAVMSAAQQPPDSDWFNACRPIVAGSCPRGDVYLAARVGDVARLRELIAKGADVNARDDWDSVPLYYASLSGHDAALVCLLEAGAQCDEATFDGDRIHYCALNPGIRATLRRYVDRPPPLTPLASALRAAIAPAAGAPSMADMAVHVDDGGPPVAIPRWLLAARCPSLRRPLAARWAGASAIRGGSLGRGTCHGPHADTAVRALITAWITDRVDVPTAAAPALAHLARRLGCTPLADAVDRELSTSARYVVLKGGGEGPRRLVVTAVPGAALADDLTSLAARCAAAATAGSWGTRCGAQAAGCCPGVCPVADTVAAGHPCRRGHHCTAAASAEDFADVVLTSDDGRRLRTHRGLCAARSEPLAALLDRSGAFREGVALGGTPLDGPLPVVNVGGISGRALARVVQFVYADRLESSEESSEESSDTSLEVAAELLDAGARFLIPPLQRAAGDAAMAHLTRPGVGQAGRVGRWLLLADAYGVSPLRESLLAHFAAVLLRSEVSPGGGPAGDAADALASLASAVLPPSAPWDVGAMTRRNTAATAPGSDAWGGEGGGINGGDDEAGRSAGVALMLDVREKFLEGAAHAVGGGRDAAAAAFDSLLVEMLAAGD